MRIMIVEDLEHIIDILRCYLNEHEIIGIAMNKTDAIKNLNEISADILLLDVSLTEDGLEGIEILQHIKENNIKIGVIMLTGSSQNEIIQKCYSYEILGYASKLNISNINHAIKFFSGNKTVANSISENMRHILELELINNLTNTELKVFELVKEGLSKSEIAKTLNVSYWTIKTHVKNINIKLGTKNMTEMGNIRG